MERDLEDLAFVCEEMARASQAEEGRWRPKQKTSDDEGNEERKFDDGNGRPRPSREGVCAAGIVRGNGRDAVAKSHRQNLQTIVEE